ncbi:hypothetical protein CBS147339_9621 [Penicillium roqueforti]|nr:hypothetical protein DTO012A8_9462 [Penicillium roqueforti]KAI3063653.1 hypothetical protein CBS147339_9621 [Penicillium roqueforti]KAI3129039.1 hypothetical protein CBS147325_9705 [Penicillium roqueforti]KAI3181969.1 hypothetical protein DTO032C6_7729 [Penicillium roqueforti]
MTYTEAAPQENIHRNLEPTLRRNIPEPTETTSTIRPHITDKTSAKATLSARTATTARQPKTIKVYPKARPDIDNNRLQRPMARLSRLLSAHTKPQEPNISPISISPRTQHKATKAPKPFRDNNVYSREFKLSRPGTILAANSPAVTALGTPSSNDYSQANNNSLEEYQDDVLVNDND